MNQQLTDYNKRVINRWLVDANQKESEIFFTVAVGIMKPHDIHMFWDNNRGLDSVIDTTERLLKSLREQRDGKSESGIILLR